MRSVGNQAGRCGNQAGQAGNQGVNQARRGGNQAGRAGNQAGNQAGRGGNQAGQAGNQAGGREPSREPGTPPVKPCEYLGSGGGIELCLKETDALGHKK